MGRKLLSERKLRFSLRLPESTLANLTELSNVEGVSISTYINAALREHLIIKGFSPPPIDDPYDIIPPHLRGDG